MWRRRPTPHEIFPTSAKELSGTADIETVLELTIRWIAAAAMIVLFLGLARRNRRAGYQKPPRQALLAEVVVLVRELEEALYVQERQEPTPEVPAIAETPVDQLLRLSLAIQSGESVSASNDVAPETVQARPQGVTADR